MFLFLTVQISNHIMDTIVPSVYISICHSLNNSNILLAMIVTLDSKEFSDYKIVSKLLHDFSNS